MPEWKAILEVMLENPNLVIKSDRRAEPANLLVDEETGEELRRIYNNTVKALTGRGLIRRRKDLETWELCGSLCGGLK